MSWEPQPQVHTQLLEVLQNSLRGNNVAQRQATQQLREAQAQPDFANYLMAVLIDDKAGPLDVRSSAGLLLKNLIRFDFKDLNDAGKTYVKQHVFTALVEPANIIRNTAGTIVASLMQREGISGWPDGLTTLMGLAESDNAHAQLGGMDALSKICEDMPVELDQTYGSERPLEYMVPKFLQFARDPESSHQKRVQALTCLNHIVEVESQSIVSRMDEYLAILFELANTPDVETRIQICNAFTGILRTSAEKIAPHLGGVIQYALHCISASEEGDTLDFQACEFLLLLTELDPNPEALSPHLGDLVPAVLRAMVYSETDVFMLEGINEDDADVADREEDLKPINFRQKAAHGNKKNGAEGQDPEEDESDDEEDDEVRGLEAWNLRKCAASTLDRLSNILPEEVLEAAMPYLKQTIVSDEWPAREAAILAFGAIADGCQDMVAPHLPELVPFLIQRLSDQQFPVRQVCCWTLGRFSTWVCEQSMTEQDTYFIPTLTGLFTCALDRNKKVQVAGCSAVATFTDEARNMLTPYLGQILEQFALCFRRYQKKSLLFLYDAVSTLVKYCGAEIAENNQYMETLMQPLIAKWEQISDDDNALWPLFECMSAVASYMGPAFGPYAQPVFDRCARLLHACLIQDQNFANDPSQDPAERDFMVTAIDLIDGLVLGLKDKAAPLMMNSEPPFMELLLVCCHDEFDVRQSTFALIGDMAALCPQPLEPYMDQLMSELLAQVEYNHIWPDAVSNTCWSLGEIALRFGNKLQPLLQASAADRLIALLRTRDASPRVLENASTAIGRIGITMPDIFAQRIPDFIIAWCLNMHDAMDNSEKESAFVGMCTIIGANPQALDNSTLLMFVNAVARYLEPSEGLMHTFRQVLGGLKGMHPNFDKDVTEQLPPIIQKRLRDVYGV